MTRAEKGWLAGVVDSEGTFVAYLRPHQGKDAFSLNIRLAVSNRHPRLIERCRLLFEAITGASHKVALVNHDAHQSVPHAQPIYQLQAWRLEHVQAIARTLLPHLVAKKDQAVLLLDYLGRRGVFTVNRPRDTKTIETDRQFVQQMKRLNARYHYAPVETETGDLSSGR